MSRDNISFVDQRDRIPADPVYRPILLRITVAISHIGANPADSDDLRLQKTLLIYGCVTVIIATILWGVAYIVLREPLAGAVSLFYATVSSFSLILFHITRHYRFFRASQMLLGLFLPFIITIILGGLLNSSVVILWSLIIPLAALLLSEPREALKWWFAYLALVVLSGILQPVFRTSNNLPPTLIVGFLVLNISVVSSIFIFTLYYFIIQKNNAFRLLHIEEKKSENLLLNILPKEIAAILRNENRTIADQFEEASILFADLVGFTTLSTEMAPVEIVNLLSEIFSYFDSLVEKFGLEKIRTIGDNYMVVAGVPTPRTDHALAIAHLALDMSEYIHDRHGKGERRVAFRIGINSGPVIGGVIGRKKFVYDVWGDAVNIASRMESHGVPGKIQITQETYELIRDKFVCEPRGTISIKGKGMMETWYLLGVKQG